MTVQLSNAEPGMVRTERTLRHTHLTTQLMIVLKYHFLWHLSHGDFTSLFEK